MRRLASKRPRDEPEIVEQAGAQKKRKTAPDSSSARGSVHPEVALHHAPTDRRGASASSPPTRRTLALTKKNLQLFAKKERAQPKQSSPVTREPLPAQLNSLESEDDAPLDVDSKRSTTIPARTRKPPARSPDTGGTFPRLRSGRSFSHPRVLEAATIQISSLSEFEFVPRQVVVQSEYASSQATVTDISLSETVTASQSTMMPPSSPLRADSQTSSPTPGLLPAQSPCAPLRYRYTGSQIVPAWYAEVFESDGYDSEALALISTPPRRTGGAEKERGPAHLLTQTSAASSPSVAVIADTSLASAQDEWRPDSWPADVDLIHEHNNPHKWKFPGLSAGVRGGAGCGCEFRCNAASCLNAKSGRFCTAYNCSFAGTCGNSLRESPALSISRNLRTGMRGLTANEAIPAGEVIGEYFGEIDLFGPPCKNGPVNEGYRMHLKTKTTGGKYVGIDALKAGGMLRLMNHSCIPSARFHEVQTGRQLTVVAVTVRDIYPGEEVTVSYGDRLWFVCRCGWWGCQHRDLQHLHALNSQDVG